MGTELTELLRSPLFCLMMTLGVYSAARQLYLRTGSFLLHPVLVSVACIIGFLAAAGIAYEDYFEGARFIHFLLGPSVVALGLPLYDRMKELRREAPALIASSLVAGAAGIISVTVPLVLAGVPKNLVVSLAPKSVTTPIAMSIAEAAGGEPSLTAAVVVATGILGAVTGPLLLRLSGITSGISFGLALGSAAHGIGTARALEKGESEGAGGGLAICLNGIATAVLTPLLLPLILKIGGLV